MNDHDRTKRSAPGASCKRSTARPEHERRGLHSIEVPVRTSATVDADRDWFARHPARCYRVRWITADETDLVPAPPAGHHWVLVVRKIAPARFVAVLAGASRQLPLDAECVGELLYRRARADHPELEDVERLAAVSPRRGEPQ